MSIFDRNCSKVLLWKFDFRNSGRNVLIGNVFSNFKPVLISSIAHCLCCWGNSSILSLTKFSIRCLDCWSWSFGRSLQILRIPSVKSLMNIEALYCRLMFRIISVRLEIGSSPFYQAVSRKLNIYLGNMSRNKMSQISHNISQIEARTLYQRLEPRFQFHLDIIWIALHVGRDGT